MAELGLFPGTPITIERIGNTRYVEEKFHGRIETADAAQVKVLLPLTLVQLLPLYAGEEIQLKASLPEGMYRFSGRIIEILPTGFTMPYPFGATRLQRREQRRIPSDGIVVFAVREASGRPNFGTVIDVSIGGLQIQSEKWLPVGAQLQIEFNLQAGLHGATNGIVRWKKDAKDNSADHRLYGYGLKFVDIEEQLKRQIADLIRDHERAMLGALTEASMLVPGK